MALKQTPARIHRLHPLALACLLLAFSRPALALDPDRTIYQYNCQTWRRANGLPANAVTAIAQTRHGRIWLGSSQGLVLFDGLGFHVYELEGEEGADRKIINSLARRSDGGLWLGLDRGSFGYFEFQQFHSLATDEMAGPFATVRTLMETRDKRLLVAGPALAGNWVSTNSYISMRPGTNGPDVFSMLEDPQGRIWMGTAQHGLFYWQAGQCHAFPDHTLEGAVIPALAMDQAGNLWVATASELRCYDTNQQPMRLPQTIAHPKALLVDRHGVVWIGSGRDGLVRYQDGKFTSLHKQDGLAGEEVLCLLESEDGSLWVGTGDGLSELSDVKLPILSQTEGLANAACLAVAADPTGGIWLGTPNGASHYRNGQIANFGMDRADGFGSDWNKLVFGARNGDAYFIGAAKNLDRFSGGGVVRSWTNQAWPRALAEDSHGVMVALGDDLLRVKGDELVRLHLADGNPPAFHWINYLLVARDDSLWVADNDAVYQIKDGRLYNWSQTNGISKSTLFYLCEADDGAVWAAQRTGIARFKNGRVSFITRHQGLHEDFVYAMVADTLGNFWMDSNRGIFRVSQAELNAVADGRANSLHCAVFEGEDSVKTTDKAAQEYSGCRSTDGRIWFPSSKGVIMIDPNHVPADSPPPPVSIESVRINGRGYDSGRAPKLEPGPGNLEIDYLAVDYRAPRKVQYRYRLNGFDSDWVEAGTRRSAFYTNLKPGDYRFEVQAGNSDGVWDSAAADFAFHLPQRLYETLLFRVAAAFSLLGAGSYVWRSQHVRRREVRLQQTQTLLESKVAERTAELTREIEERKRAQADSERLQGELIEASRRAGMAEVATGVLHNVGNVLNSVNVSASMLANSLEKSKSPSLGRAAAMMQEHAADLGAFITSDPKGSRLPAYLTQLADCLAQERANALEEVSQLQKNVEHIKDIVAMQQGLGHTAGVSELVTAAELVEDALRMNLSGLSRHDIQVVKDFDAPRVIPLERHKVVPILVNLVRNAQQACTQIQAGEKTLTIRIRHASDRLRIAVSDNGVGIAPENLTRIFAHGFTTKKDGHGFGLHSGALAAKEMGGALAVASAGPGQGATFTLDLPCASSGEADAKPQTDRFRLRKYTAALA
jgi:ligand-binding sensor domain-containing protein/signal transduction histidine kinase